jgi:chromosome segregation ATPase
MSGNQHSQRGRISRQSRGTTGQSRISGSMSRVTKEPLPRFGRPKPTREIRPSEIHELRMQTLRVQTEVKLQQTKLNRLKERILNKTEAINRTLKQKANEQSATSHQSAIVQLERSITGARNTLEQLQEDLEEASYDDRTAVYQELEEELRATYLEYERQQSNLEEEKEESRRLEQELKKVDDIASMSHLNELREHIERVKKVNTALRAKWLAYQKKMHNMNIEHRIAENRERRLKSKETNEQTTEEYERNHNRLMKLKNVLESQNDDYQKKVDELIDIIDNQRRRIVQHLMGQDASDVSNEDQINEQN